jgi:hypothetical protein
MGNPLLLKQLRMVLFGGITAMLAIIFLGSLSFGDVGTAFATLIFGLIPAYLGFGLDIQRKNKAVSRINDYISKHMPGDSILLVEDSYLDNHGRGHLALTQHWFIFVNRKGEILEFNLHDLTNYGYKYVGTGQYATTFHKVGGVTVGSTREGKVPIFYLETVKNNKEWVLAFFCLKHKKFFKLLDSNWKSGSIAKERHVTEQKQRQLDAMKDAENSMILRHFNQIMDPELTELERGTRVLLQNGKVYEEALYGLYQKNMPKLHALNESEERFLLDYFNICTIRGYRMAVAALLANGYKPDENDNGLIFSEEVLEGKYESVGRVDYPALEQLAYAQYKFFRNSQNTFLSETEVLDMTKEFIKVGFKNAKSNYLALKELKAKNRVPVNS